ncbi:hypothetical protein CAC42_5806 [Sphaceloma murrayae]|uniref:BTB domain-containing protein n=1 Tax=Sphaceloma murrayae TaxID=2082308 RepID=A0A2K1QZ76_9PEZI|nr:hypothetical protein CAC42_5806 [Sphaceloma murrayae]
MSASKNPTASASQPYPQSQASPAAAVSPAEMTSKATAPFAPGAFPSHPPAADADAASDSVPPQTMASFGQKGTPTAPPPQTVAALERIALPLPRAPPQTISALEPTTPITEKPKVKDETTIAIAASKPDSVVTHDTIIISTPAEPHTGATPAPQVAPTSIILPAPTPSTTTVIAVPPTPDHVTVAPAFPPSLAIVPATSEQPTTPKPDRVKVQDPYQHSVQRVDTLADLPAHTGARSRRNSASDSTSPVARSKPTGLPLPTRPAYGRSASSGDLRSGMPSPMIPKGAVEVLVASVHLQHAQLASSPAHQHDDPLSMIDLYAGKNKKHFSVHRHLLVIKVPHFHSLFSHDTSPSPGRLTFEDLDEYGFALFQHYLSLYVLAHRFGVESLQNEVMDLCRAYYRHQSMTAPAYRIEYIYTYTSSPNHMRNFLTTTAAYRLLCEAPAAPGVYMTDSMKTLLAKQGDLGVDFAESLIKLSKNGLVDVRKGDPCVFHVHSDGKVCEAVGLEPYQSP